MASRRELTHDLIAASNGLLHLEDVDRGWPSLLHARRRDGTVAELAIFLGPIGRSHRQRDDAERRFQNPGKDKPIIISTGRTPLLMGVWGSDPEATLAEPVLAVAEIDRRADRRTRFSVFFPLAILETANTHGWAEARSDTDEHLLCFRISELDDFLEIFRYGLSGTRAGATPRAVRSVLSDKGRTVDEVLQVVRTSRTIEAASVRLSVPEGVTRAVFEHAGRPFILAEYQTQKSAVETAQALWYLRSAAEQLGTQLVSRSVYGRVARQQNITVERWPSAATIARLHGGWSEACEAAGLDSPATRELLVRYPGQRCRQLLDDYVAYCVRLASSPGRSSYSVWRHENNGPSVNQIESELGPFDEQLRNSLNRID